MSRSLLIAVRFHDGRFHGTGDVPPAPARLFQALIAGAGLGGPLGQRESNALEWLERREPPVIAAPRMVDAQRVKTFVPNNDFDVVGGDPRRVGKIRTEKEIAPRLFDSEVPCLYSWTFDADEESERQAAEICSLAERLYQFGRGVDMAWSWGEVLDTDESEGRLSSHAGNLYRPSPGGTGNALACPVSGSLASLEARYASNSERFRTEGRGAAARQLFSQPPKPRFAQVAYDCPPSRRLFELREGSPEASFEAWPLARSSSLVVWLRDGAVARLQEALPEQTSVIERVLVGRKANGEDGGPSSSRVRIVPLPSIGSPDVHRGIRRVLIEIPAGCQIRAEDIHWAFSGLEIGDPETGELLNIVLTPSDDERMLIHYGADDNNRSRVWRTVTPAVLSEAAMRRRIEPTRIAAEAKDGGERAIELARASDAVAQAFRHAGVRNSIEAVRLQREPFESKGERVEAFAPGTRFAKERMWHVEVEFRAPVAGPLVIGDGRFLGLGLMAPLRRSEGIHVFEVKSGLVDGPDPIGLARALRRAVMARIQVKLGLRDRLGSFFTGHDRIGSPARSETSPHLAFLFDPRLRRLLVLAPHVLERRAAAESETRHLEVLDAALEGFRELRAGSAGILMLRATSVDLASDPLFAPSRTWESVTDYDVTRHLKRVGAGEALAADVRAECRRRALPAPRVTPQSARGVARRGLVGSVTLSFEVAVPGPLVLGRSRHIGGGLFSGAA